MPIEPPTGPLWDAVAPMAPWPQPNEDVLAALAADWRTAGDQFAEVGRTPTDVLAAAWASDAGAAFVARTRAELAEATTSAGVMTGLGDRAERFADEVMQLKLAIHEVIAVNDGTYVGFTTLPVGMGGPFAVAFAASTADIINQLVTDTAGRVSGQGAPVTLPPLPPADASPQENAAFWDTLTESQKLQLAREHPEEVGRRDGFPAGYRDIANRTLLDSERARLETELADLRARSEDLHARGVAASGVTDPGAEFARISLDGQLQQTEAKLRGLDELARRIDAPVAQHEGVRHYLLDIDATGDGQAVVATGNPDTAENVATVVPGTTTDLASFNGVVDMADATYRAADAAAGGSESTAVIAWLGYDAPDEIYPDAPSPSYAEEGKDDLDAFQEGLRASRDGLPSHNTVIGHSYGATVAGFAARDHVLPVDEFVSVAGPGVGADTAQDLNVPEGHVWATEAHDDPVGDVGALNVGGFGPSQLGGDPTSWFFGARTFDADAEDPGLRPPDYFGNYESHSRYWDENRPNPALDGLGDIVVGNEPDER